MSSDSSDVFCYFLQWYIILQLFIMHTWPSWNRVIIAPKWGVPDGNHMNDDVAEVNGSASPMLPGSFLHKKEPGYKAIYQAMLPDPENSHHSDNEVEIHACMSQC